MGVRSRSSVAEGWGLCVARLQWEKLGDGKTLGHDRLVDWMTELGSLTAWSPSVI